MKAFSPLSATASERIREESLAHYIDAHIEAEAVADSALHDVADFSCTMRVWKKADVEKFAALNMIAAEAEDRRRKARARLVAEWCDQVKTILAEEDAS